MADSSALVQYEGETLSVLEKPPRECKAVVAAKKQALGVFDLNDFLDKLVMVGKFIRIAYNGVAGDSNLQIVMRELGYEIAELCDESGLAIGQFRITADSVLTDLTVAYQFLLDDMEEMAVTSLENIGQSAKSMVETTEKLVQRFEDEKNKVKQVYRDTAIKKGAKENDLKELEEEEKKWQAESDQREKERELAVKEEEKLHKEIESAYKDEMKATEQLAPNAADVVLGIVSLGVVPIVRQHYAASIMKNIHSRLERLQKHKKEEVERQRAALNDIAQFAKKIIDCSDKEMNVKEQAIPALHAAVGALNILVTIMQSAATFWRTIQTQCEEMAKGKMKNLMETAKKYEDPSKRMKAYQSSGVKQRAMKAYVEWEAIEGICDDCVSKVKISREELYKYLRENPTIEESKKRIALLSREFQEDIAKADKELMKKMEEIDEKKMT